jgi:hypothetical protein
VLVQEKHAGLRRHRDLLVGRSAVVRVEDCLTPDATFGGGGQVEKQGPGSSSRDGGLGRQGDVVRIIVFEIRGYESAASAGVTGKVGITAGMGRAMRYGQGVLQRTMAVKVLAFGVSINTDVGT